MTSLNQQCLPMAGDFHVNDQIFPYRILQGEEAALTKNYYRPKGGEQGHALALEGGPAAGLRLVETALPHCKVKSKRDILVNHGRAIAKVGGYFVIGVQACSGGKFPRLAIIFITDDGYPHQHYESNVLDSPTAIHKAFQQLVDNANNLAMESIDETTSTIAEMLGEKDYVDEQFRRLVESHH